MSYDLKKTSDFERWFKGIKDIQTKARIVLRIKQVSMGNFGDHKSLGSGLSELRLFFGSGYRIYYTVKKGQVVILLAGGDKSSQAKDIKKARHILNEWR